MLECVDIKIRAEGVIDMPQHVQIELGRDALLVVISAINDARVLLQVDADQQLAAFAGLAMHNAQQLDGLVAFEIADRRAGEIDDVLRRCRRRGGHIERPGEVGDDRVHGDVRKLAADALRRVVQMFR